MYRQQRRRGKANSREDQLKRVQRTFYYAGGTRSNYTRARAENTMGKLHTVCFFFFSYFLTKYGHKSAPMRILFCNNIKRVPAHAVRLFPGPAASGRECVPFFRFFFFFRFGERVRKSRLPGRALSAATSARLRSGGRQIVNNDRDVIYILFYRRAES